MHYGQTGVQKASPLGGQHTDFAYISLTFLNPIKCFLIAINIFSMFFIFLYPLICVDEGGKLVWAPFAKAYMCFRANIYVIVHFIQLPKLLCNKGTLSQQAI